MKKKTKEEKDFDYMEGWMAGTALAITQLDKMGMKQSAQAFARWLSAEMERLNPGLKQ